MKVRPSRTPIEKDSLSSVILKPLALALAAWSVDLAETEFELEFNAKAAGTIRLLYISIVLGAGTSRILNLCPPAVIQKRSGLCQEFVPFVFP